MWLDYFTNKYGSDSSSNGPAGWPYRKREGRQGFLGRPGRSITSSWIVLELRLSPVCRRSFNYAPCVRRYRSRTHTHTHTHPSRDVVRWVSFHLSIFLSFFSVFVKNKWSQSNNWIRKLTRDLARCVLHIFTQIFHKKKSKCGAFFRKKNRKTILFFWDFFGLTWGRCVATRRPQEEERHLMVLYLEKRRFCG